MVSTRDADYSSSSEDDTVTQTNGLVNGVKKVVISNGADTPKTPEASAAPDAPEEHVADGMQCGLKHLYSGKEDKKGRFKWQDTIPEDLGKPVENAETLKWALLVRHVKVYNDPRKVLALHSIVVQSPYLKKLLENVLSGYPGVTTGLQRLEFSGRFEPLIHRWQNLKEAFSALSDDSEEDRNTKQHAQLLVDLIESEFKDMLADSSDMRANGVMRYDYLWTIFQPGMTLFSKQDGQECALKLHETVYGKDRFGNPCFWVTGKYVDWDGTRFGTNKLNIPVMGFCGTRPIAQMAVYPLDYHKNKDTLTERLVERGTRAEALAGSHYKGYHGVGWRKGMMGTREKYNIKGRVVIDTYGWNRFNTNNAIYVTSLHAKDPMPSGSGGDDEDNGEDDEDEYDDGDEECEMPNDGNFADEEEDKRTPLTTEQKLICTPLLRGYALKEKMWLNFFVNAVREIEWSSGAFESLVLPSNQKELILGFTETQRKYRETFDDVIEGKGKGIILLLCGPPGVGKTLTAESVAEEMKVPLYMMSAGDLGLEARGVESKLQNILEMCTRWNAILLLDEADVFLEQRSLHELERNKLVSVFLRTLEYYEGIMFLTTNRVETFDPAFQSRIHISIQYPELSIESRRTVWKNFLAVGRIKHDITERQLDALSHMNMNGRQIKNVLKTAQLLATRKEVPLSHAHVTSVLDVTQHLHNATMENERTKSSIFC